MLCAATLCGHFECSRYVSWDYIRSPIPTFSGLPLGKTENYRCRRSSPRSLNSDDVKAFHIFANYSADSVLSLSISCALFLSYPSRASFEIEESELD